MSQDYNKAPFSLPGVSEFGWDTLEAIWLFEAPKGVVAF